jgi:hypothetical protein
MSLREEIAAAVEELAAIPFFPSETGARLAVMKALESFVRRPHELRWLIDTAVARMREWKGPAELRGLYCTRFSPRDGIEEYCTIPGFTAAESETGYHQLQVAETDRRLLEYRRQKQLAPPGAVFEAPELPAPKPVDPPPVNRTDEGIRSREGRERLATIANTTIPPVKIPATPIRTPEERERLRAELSERLIGLGWTPEQVLNA